MTAPDDIARTIRYGAPHTPTQAERDAQAALWAVQGIATRLGLPWTVTEHAGGVTVHVDVEGVGRGGRHVDHHPIGEVRG